MTFTVYALMQDNAPPMSNDTLAEDLKRHFRDEEGFSLTFEQLPFASDKSLALRWDDWLVRISYEEGEEVINDSIEIQRRTGADSGHDVSRIRRRIRAVFGSDETQEYTNQMIYVLDYLKELEGVIVFDPQQNDFVQ
ncbi:hypothetical protein KY495_22940 [Massilia sp. PAMC28688]|uniref:hypothetical protein n=1 Tax=Massilia sp. PAMC28688 TaxID=2861283 RepID=UPI001C632591|nr:hypothetical protein [Massilia sp. PAMC28688]QYF93484.1 hypothetical protein KY495_22940 [Massilia sp. PAMC28688]